MRRCATSSLEFESFVVALTLGCASPAAPPASPPMADEIAEAGAVETAPARGALPLQETAVSSTDLERDVPTDEANVADGSSSEGSSPEGSSPEGSSPDAVAAADERAEPRPLPEPIYSKIDPSCGNDPGVGQQLKPFSLPTVDGKAVTPKSWGRRVLLVNFWGTWCKPCLEELPIFDRLYRRYRAHGLTLVAIATDEDRDAVQAYLQKSKLAAKVAIAGEDYAGTYGSPKFPFTFLVDPSGEILAAYRGYEPRCLGKLEADVRAALERRRVKSAPR